MAWPRLLSVCWVEDFCEVSSGSPGVLQWGRLPNQGNAVYCCPQNPVFLAFGTLEGHEGLALWRVHLG